MSIRNEDLLDVLVALGGTPTNTNSRNAIIADILAVKGVVNTNPQCRNEMLEDYLVDAVERSNSKSPLITNQQTHNSAMTLLAILDEIVVVEGGSVTNPKDRNQLIRDWCNAVSHTTEPIDHGFWLPSVITGTSSYDEETLDVTINSPDGSLSGVMTTMLAPGAYMVSGVNSASEGEIELTSHTDWAGSIDVPSGVFAIQLIVKEGVIGIKRKFGHILDDVIVSDIKLELV